MSRWKVIVLFALGDRNVTMGIKKEEKSILLKVNAYFYDLVLSNKLWNFQYYQNMGVFIFI